jgi:hypothetical protein
MSLSLSQDASPASVAGGRRSAMDVPNKGDLKLFVNNDDMFCEKLSIFVSNQFFAYG